MLSRRQILTASAAAIPVAALSACGITGAQLVTLTQTALSDATNVIAGINAALVAAGMKGISSQTYTKISTYVVDAQGLLVSIAGAVGSGVSGLTVQGIFTDLEAGVNAVAPYLPGNPYVLAAEALLPILAAGWGLLVPAGANAVAVPMTPDQARALLSQLPRPGLLAGVRQQA